MKAILLAVFILLSLLQQSVSAQKIMTPSLDAKQGQKLLSAKPGWAHAAYSSETQMLRFLNSKEGASLAEFRLAANRTETGQLVFHLFYQDGTPPSDFLPWQVRRVSSAEEALDFVNSQGAFAKTPEKEFRLCGAATEKQPSSFWIFYRKYEGRTPEAAKGEWRWKWEAFDRAEEVQSFLTRRRSEELLTDVEITGVGDKFHVFYRAPHLYDAPGMPTPVWNWLKRENTASLLAVLNTGTGREQHVIQSARIAAIHQPSGEAFYLFY